MRTPTRRRVFAFLLMGLTAIGVCRAANPFTNGSFEGLVFPPGGNDFPVGSTNVTGWVRGGPGQVSIINGPAAGIVNAADGDQQIDFNSGDSVSGATLSQEFLTTIGQPYEVSFQVGLVGSGGPMSVVAEVTSGTGALLGSLSSTAPSTAGYGSVRSFTFTATTTNSTLKFTDTSSATAGVDVLLDNVRVVPEDGVCVTPPTGLVSWWPGNSNTIDLAGSHNGTWSGIASYVSGEVGQAFDFNGVDSQVSFGNTVGNFDTNDFTVEFWLRTTSSRHEAVIEKMPSCGYASLWTIWIGGAAPWSGPGRLEAQSFSDSSASDANSISAGRAINDGLFHHVALVRRGTNLFFYIDGVADVAASAMSGTVSKLNNAADLAVGRSACGASGILPFTGQMDEISVYSRALSAVEIQSIYQAGTSGKCAPVLPPPLVGPFTNGSFELPVLVPGTSVSLSPGTGELTGWTVGAAGLVSFASGPVGSVSPSTGSQQISFNGSDAPVGGSIWQTFGTTVGEVYTVSFDVGRVFSGSGAMSLLAEVSSGTGTVLGSLTAIAPGLQGYGPVQSFAFTAATTNSTLKFTDTSSATTVVDILLDNVRVEVDNNVCVTPPAGLVDWWQGEGNSDSAITANRGVWVNGASFASGKVGQAFDFGGSNHIVIPASPGLNVQSLTIEAWIAPNDVSDYRPVVEYSAPNGSYGLHLWLSVPADGSPGVTPGSLYVNLDGSARFGTTGGVVPANQWTHVALTYDQASGVARLYVNGVSLANTNFGSISPMTAMPVNLGYRSSSGHRFAGKMDEVSIYSRALTAVEVLSVFQSGSEGKCPVPPTILTQPQGQAVPAGLSVAFAVDAVGAQPLTYQWYLNGTNIAGGTTASLTLTNIQHEDIGVYNVVVSNDADSVTSSNAILTLIGSTCFPAPSGSVGWWQCEGNANDGYATNNGTWINGVSFASGQVGQAFKFGGTNHVLIPASPNLNVQSLTIETWIAPDDVSSIRPIVEYTAPNGQFGLHLWLSVPADGSLSVTPGSLYANLSGEFSPNRFGTAGGAIPANQWTHVALTFDQPSGFARLYVNGVNLTNANFGSVIPGTAMPLTLGYRPSSGHRFVGRMDELTIYNRALGAAEILSIFQSGSDGKCPLPPGILTQPQSQAVPVGLGATFSVGALGAQPLDYQWLVGGTNIFGATNSSLTLANIKPDDAGAYSVVVSNAAGSITSSNAFLTVTPLICAPAPSGLTAWWRGEGAVNDEVSTNNGAWIGGSSFAPGKVGQAFNFGGANHVAIPASPDLSLQTLTIEAWISPDDIGNYRPVVEYSTPSGDFGLHLWLSVPADGSPGFTPGSVYANLGGSSRFGTSGGAVPANQWTHIALTYEQVSGIARLYVNGVSLANTNFGSITPATDRSLVLGYRSSSGHRFVGRMDEVSIYNRALTAAEIQSIVQARDGKCPPPPTILAQPQRQTVPAGTNVTLRVSATGAQPLNYQWYLNGTNISSANSPSLTLTNVGSQDAGKYTVVVSNSISSVTSDPALLDVRYVFIFGNGENLTNSQYSFILPVAVQIQSIFTNGTTFYTLDGSAPSFASTPYVAPFTLAQSAVLRVIAYSADFFQSSEVDPITVLILPTYTISATSAGGGTIQLSPAIGPYPSNSIVDVTATPTNGWSFLGWAGDSNSTNTTIALTMNGNKSVQARFGTTLSTTAAGGGSITLNPPGGLYPYGTVVRLYPVPQAGNYFALWGNSGSGSSNPFVLALTNAAPTVSSLFAPLGSGEFALAVVPQGPGEVTVNPQANRYNSGASVTLTPVPDAGKHFIDWTGDAGGIDAPLIVVMNQSKTITANFAQRPVLSVIGESGGVSDQGFRMTLTGEIGGLYRIDGSTNLIDWAALVTLTNSFGSTQFTDGSATNLSQRYYRAVTVP